MVTHGHPLFGFGPGYTWLFFLCLLWGLVPVLERELQMSSGAEEVLKFLVEPVAATCQGRVTCV